MEVTSSDHVTTEVSSSCVKLYLLTNLVTTIQDPNAKIKRYQITILSLRSSEQHIYGANRLARYNFLLVFCSDLVCSWKRWLLISCPSQQQQQQQRPFNGL